MEGRVDMKHKTFAMIFSLILLASADATAAEKKAAAPAKKAAPSASADLKSACSDSVKKNNKPFDAESVCGCIARGVKKKKISSEEVALLVKNYQGKLNLKAEAKKNPDLIDPLFEFEEHLAESCIEDSKFEVVE